MGIVAIRKKNQVQGGEIITRILAAEGVDTVFGIVDGTYLGMLAHLKENGLRLVTPRHETSAAHAAGAYARLTGTLGVCIASNGPGVANVLPGVAVEQVEGNRVLLITSCRREGLMGPDRGGAYQHFAQVDVTRPMTKWSVAVSHVDRLAEVMRRALRIAFTGRPGVVHVDVPESIMNGSFEVDPSWFQAPASYRPLDALPPTPALVAAAARLLANAKRVVIHAGSGVVHAHAYAELARVAALLEAPITTSWGARCAVDERDRHALPMVHIETVTQARTEADVVLCLGSRLGETDWWGKAPYWGNPATQKMIQVNIDAEALGNTRPADLLIHADVRLFLAQLIEALESRWGSLDLAPRVAWLDSLKAHQAQHRAKLDAHLDDRAVPMNPAHIAAACQRVLPADTVTVFDGGNTAVWGNFFHQARTPGCLLGTPKMGMLGAGVSQAIGAAVARPGRPVVCIIGDGAMGMHQQEVETAVRNGLQVLYLVVSDRQWGMVKMSQQFALKPLKTLVMKTLSPRRPSTPTSPRRGSTTSAARWGRMGSGWRIRRAGGALRRSLATGKTAVIRRRRSGEAPVGAGPARLQGDAPGAGK
ncbi:MAG: thiamine pyrophosphate-binding protein [bacterium]